ERQQQLAVDRVDSGDLTEDRQCQRMALPELEVEEVVDEVVGRVLGLRDLLEHDLALAVDFGGVEDRVEEEAGEQLGCHREVLAEHLGVVAGVLLAGERVEHAADRVDFLGDLCRGARARALEEQVFDEVGDPVLGRDFVARAVLYPDAEGGRDHRGHRLAQHAQAVGQDAFANHRTRRRAYWAFCASSSCASRSESRILPSRPTSSTLTMISSPSWITSSTLRTRWLESCEIWSRPSVPGRISTKAPNSTILRTLPL